MHKEYFSETSLTDEQIALYYLGQEGFLIRYHDSSLLIDPYLSDYVDRNCCTEQVKWERRYNAPVLPGQLDFADYVFCTHDHFDHADPVTLRALAEQNSKVKFIVPEPVRDTIRSYGIDAKRIIGAVAGQELCLGKCRVRPIPAADSFSSNCAAFAYASCALSNSPTSISCSPMNKKCNTLPSVLLATGNLL